VTSREEPPLLRARASLRRAMRRSSVRTNSPEPRKPKVVVTGPGLEDDESMSADPATWRSPEEREK